MSETAPRPVLLCILDGWGEAPPSEHNAIALARTPNWDRFMAEAPHALIEASESHVGLPAGQMGNSEVGHMNLGAGRVVMQDLPRIDAAIADGTLDTNPVLTDLIARARAAGGTCHLMGLLSPGGVHSHEAHIYALARRIDAAGVPVAIHAFLDGRDTPPQSAIDYMRALQAAIAPLAGARIASVTGRYYAMDRDTRWERTELAWRTLVLGEGERTTDPLAAIEQGYARGETDEFLRPTAIAGYDGMHDGDALVAANFRADRMRQILTALLDPSFAGFVRVRQLTFVAAAGMTEYSSALNPFMTTIFPSEALTDTLGEVVARAGLKQLRAAETEKYAHVTFFLNGGEERLFEGEDRILVPSPKVATYDLQPEMSAPELTDRLVEAIRSGKYDLIVANYANTDMVGHSGDRAAAMRAVEAVDICLGRLAAAIEEVGGAMLITADHGNAEMMHDSTSDQPHTAHTINPVPVVLVARRARTAGTTLANGKLADIAPTVLSLMGLPQPAAMTGHSLLPASASSERRAAR
ncbi:MAG: 2,3-bisphosphoglycerate-independent phosphoglycerate mutase [Rhodospirillaceae bacterium]|nr:2,3-bisphosphoglycerate-independent phosphoglycerate mutase [Rhodospirillaceae bacterium]